MLLNQIRQHFNEPKAYKIDHVQTLWSGYGEIARYFLPNQHTTCIVKSIDLSINHKAQKTHPRGWNTELSHNRKFSSYKNEQAFYQYYSQLTEIHQTNNGENDLSASKVNIYTCKVPQPLVLNNDQKCMWFAMQDLDSLGYTGRVAYTDNDKPKDLLLSQAKQCVTWLANFHALFLNKRLDKVWPVGTYWHLATRPDEFTSMPDSGLKKAATSIDHTLNTTPYQTLVHGDAKLANFCFNSAQQSVAAVDFQYVGKGTGIKDLVYFLGSCFNDTALFEHAETFTEFYFERLQACHRYLLSSSNAQQHKIYSAIDYAELERQWRELYPFAWADFERFLQGWSPQHYKLGQYSKTQTRQVLKLL